MNRTFGLRYKWISLVLFISLFSLSVPAQELLLFAGNDHDIFLGSLNENQFSSNSVWNGFGQYGNKFNINCIWNKFGTYGNQFNTNSPWNRYSQTPPVIVDRDGNFYGYFTRNTLLANRTKIEWLVWILDNYDYVIDNLEKVRDQLF